MQTDSRQHYELRGIVEYSDWLDYCFAHPEHYFYGHPERPPATAAACLELHLEKGIRDVAWSCGRGTALYHSQDPRVTRIDQSVNLEQLEPFQRRKVDCIAGDCPLRGALDFGKRHGMTVRGLIAMNSNQRGTRLGLRPELHEIHKDGSPDGNRLCLGLDDYVAERLAIIEEVTAIGTHGVCLDFVRQPPMLRYHPALTDAYLEATGIDARAIPVHKRLTAAELESFMEWCRYRAGVLTRFMRQARERLRAVAARTGRPAPLIVRIDDTGFVGNMIGGVDIAAWCREKIVDGIILHPLQWIHGIFTHDAAPYVELGRETGVTVSGGVNSYKVEGFLLNPVCIARRIMEQYRAGVTGMAFYETNITVLQAELNEVLEAARTRESLEELLRNEAWLKAWPVNGLNANCGMDNHSALRMTCNLLSDL